MTLSKNAIVRGGIFLLAAVLIWRVLVAGFADYYAQQDTPDAAAAALGWRAGHPQALYQQGQALSARTPAVAEPLFQASVWADPSNALAYLALADLWAEEGRLPEAIRLVDLAGELGPMRTPALARSAAFWFNHDRPDLGLERWSALVQSNAATSAQVFPGLLRLADDPATRPLLLPLLGQPPAWWDRFFAYAVANARGSETAMFLYQSRNRSDALPSPAEQRVYLDRLWKDGRWLDAYLAWLGGLDDAALRGLGQIYNGGFELPISGIGFDWRVAPLRGSVVETIDTQGGHGDRSLHVALDRPVGRFQHIQQPLLLSPGAYRLQGRVRTEGLMPRQGLRWAVYCTMPKDPPIAATETFSGKDDWQSFAMELVVPAADCPIQVLRLEQEARSSPSSETEGGVWFDDLAIDRRG